jgi:site-specific recombinase XerD
VLAILPKIKRQDGEWSNFLFLNSVGTPLRDKFIRETRIRLIDKAKIHKGTTHHLRHTAASLAGAHGADSMLIERKLGVTAATARKYVNPTALDERLAQLDEEIYSGPAKKAERADALVTKALARKEKAQRKRS